MDVLFFIKKLLGLLLMPSALFFIAVLFALLLWHKGNMKAARAVSCVGVVSLYLLSVTPVVDILVRPLEAKYPSYNGQMVDYVLVLGGGHTVAADRPVSSQLSSVSLNRLTEGLMVYRANPGAKLLLSGFKMGQPESHAKVSAKVAIALGVTESDIVLAENVKDTAEEAMHWISYVGSARLALVTSATHMPRSVFLFENEIKKHSGDVSNLVPAPSYFRACVNACYRWRNWIPKGKNLALADAAWHEYLGLLWAHLRA